MASSAFREKANEPKPTEKCVPLADFKQQLNDRHLFRKNRIKSETQTRIWSSFERLLGDKVKKQEVSPYSKFGNNMQQSLFYYDRPNRRFKLCYKIKDIQDTMLEAVREQDPSLVDSVRLTMERLFDDKEFVGQTDQRQMQKMNYFHEPVSLTDQMRGLWESTKRRLALN